HAHARPPTYTLSLHDALPIFDQDVHPAERGLRLREEAADVGLVREVRLHGDRLAALSRDRRDDTVRPLLAGAVVDDHGRPFGGQDRKSTRLNSSHRTISYAVF